MIKTVPADEYKFLQGYAQYDPFQLATTRLRDVFNMLPPITINTQTEEYKNMAVKVIAESQAPLRLFKRGTVSSKQDYNDVIQALPKMTAGQALVVTMDAKAWEGVKKPETTFASNLRRLFESKNQPITAYQSATLEITIRKASPLDPKKKGKKKA